MLRIRSTLFSIVGCAAITIGCGHKSADDQTIVTGIQAKLYADPITKPASVAVTAQNGIVTLSGNVASSDVALEAMKIANGTPGVNKVNDGLTVNGAVDANQLPNGGTAPAPNPPLASNAPPPAYAQPAGPPPEVPAGERLQVRTIDRISSSVAVRGQEFRATLYAPLVYHGMVVIPAGVPVSLVVVAARSAGRIKGGSDLEVRASRIDYNGRGYPIDTSVFEETGKARGKQTAVRTGIGAVAGAVIGGLAGGGKGAAIGSAAGGGAGFGSALFTHGQQVRIPSESVLTFRLEAPLRL